jgi:hypothetical protein
MTAIQGEGKLPNSHISIGGFSNMDKPIRDFKVT